MNGGSTLPCAWFPLCCFGEPPHIGRASSCLCAIPRCVLDSLPFFALLPSPFRFTIDRSSHLLSPADSVLLEGQAPATHASRHAVRESHINTHTHTRTHVFTSLLTRAVEVHFSFMFSFAPFTCLLCSPCTWVFCERHRQRLRRPGRSLSSHAIASHFSGALSPVMPPPVAPPTTVDALQHANHVSFFPLFVAFMPRIAVSISLTLCVLRFLFFRLVHPTASNFRVGCFSLRLVVRKARGCRRMPQPRAGSVKPPPLSVCADAWGRMMCVSVSAYVFTRVPVCARLLFFLAAVLDIRQPVPVLSSPSCNASSWLTR